MKKVIVPLRIVGISSFMSLLLFVQAVAQTKTDVFDKYVEDGRKSWNVPGMSVVVVQDPRSLGTGKGKLS